MTQFSQNYEHATKLSKNDRECEYVNSMLEMPVDLFRKICRDPESTIKYHGVVPMWTTPVDYVYKKSKSILPDSNNDNSSFGHVNSNLSSVKAEDFDQNSIEENRKMIDVVAKDIHLSSDEDDSDTCSPNLGNDKNSILTNLELCKEKLPGDSERKYSEFKKYYRAQFHFDNSNSCNGDTEPFEDNSSTENHNSTVKSPRKKSEPKKMFRSITHKRPKLMFKPFESLYTKIQSNRKRAHIYNDIKHDGKRLKNESLTPDDNCIKKESLQRIFPGDKDLSFKFLIISDQIGKSSSSFRENKNVVTPTIKTASSSNSSISDPPSKPQNLVEHDVDVKNEVSSEMLYSTKKEETVLSERVNSTHRIKLEPFKSQPQNQESSMVDLDQSRSHNNTVGSGYGYNRQNSLCSNSRITAAMKAADTKSSDNNAVSSTTTGEAISTTTTTTNNNNNNNSNNNNNNANHTSSNCVEEGNNSDEYNNDSFIQGLKSVYQRKNYIKKDFIAKIRQMDTRKFYSDAKSWVERANQAKHPLDYPPMIFMAIKHYLYYNYSLDIKDESKKCHQQYLENTDFVNKACAGIRKVYAGQMKKISDPSSTCYQTLHLIQWFTVTVCMRLMAILEFRAFRSIDQFCDNLRKSLREMKVLDKDDQISMGMLGQDPNHRSPGHSNNNSLTANNSHNSSIANGNNTNSLLSNNNHVHQHNHNHSNNPNGCISGEAKIKLQKYCEINNIINNAYKNWLMADKNRSTFFHKGQDYEEAWQKITFKLLYKTGGIDINSIDESMPFVIKYIDGLVQLLYEIKDKFSPVNNNTNNNTTTIASSSSIR